MKRLVYVNINCHGAGDGPLERSIKDMEKHGFKWHRNYGKKNFKPNDTFRVVRGLIEESKIPEIRTCIDVDALFIPALSKF